MSITRILSIDGGGIKGIIPAVLLLTLEKSLQKHSHNPNARIADYFDLIAGTSTGGLLALLYLMPDHNHADHARYKAEEILQLYKENGKHIFSSTFLHRLFSLGGMIGPKYSAEPLEELLSYYYFDIKLSELIKPCLITAYDAYSKQAVFFNSLDPQKPHKSDFFVKDIARATTAAPTYFSPAKISSCNGVPFTMIDGGTTTNNPTMCAYVEAKKMLHDPAANDFMILSLGTGRATSTYRANRLNNGGVLQWARPLLDIFIAGTGETVDTQMKTLFESFSDTSSYLRIQPNMNVMGYPSIEMDDADSYTISLLEEIGLLTSSVYRADLDLWAKRLVEASIPSI